MKYLILALVVICGCEGQRTALGSVREYCENYDKKTNWLMDKKDVGCVAVFLKDIRDQGIKK